MTGQRMIAVVENLHQALLAAGRAHPTDTAARAAALAPELARAYDFEAMLRLIAGTHWTTATPRARAAAAAAFADYSAALYASRFEGGEGVRFKTQGAFQGPRGTVVVRTHLLAPGIEPVSLDYVLRPGAGEGAPAIQDVLVDGGISEVATRRSEFDRSLKEGGLETLAEALKAQTRALLDAAPPAQAATPAE
ncbi:ABC transporter substrate-binding protein [Roseospirillum parvum]|uniref:ABC transporter substrate-binding protein n=1 Tax=Roseospirillum parvum TaxID=83401 RepID=UPI0015A35C5D|nr:ABC transporter substrate-binding protein [Roseospirillum parvum]